jgi:streptogramin lyase
MAFVILEDREGNIWFGTASGLDRFRPGAFSVVDVPHPERRRSVFATKDGNLWTIPANLAEVVRISPRGAKEILGTNYEVTGISEDPSGAVWILRFTDGVYRYSGSRIAPFRCRAAN